MCMIAAPVAVAPLLTVAGQRSSLFDGLGQVALHAGQIRCRDTRIWIVDPKRREGVFPNSVLHLQNGNSISAEDRLGLPHDIVDDGRQRLV